MTTHGAIAAAEKLSDGSIDDGMRRTYLLAWLFSARRALSSGEAGSEPSGGGAEWEAPAGGPRAQGTLAPIGSPGE